MKVFFCLKYFLPEHTAGTEVYVCTLAEWLMSAGVEVAIVKPSFKHRAIHVSYYNKIKIIEYPESSTVDKQLILGNRPSSGIAFFEQVLSSEKPNIVHFHELSGSNGISIFHFRIVQKLNIKIFTTMHLIGYVCKTSELRYLGTISCNGIVDKQKCAICVLHKRRVPTFIAKGVVKMSQLLDNKIDTSKASASTFSSLFSYPTYIEKHLQQLKEIFDCSTKVFVLNHWYKQILINNQLEASKIVVVPQALPVDLPNSQLLIKPNIQKPVKLVYVGRICKIKGLDFLLKVLNKLPSNEYTLSIYGYITEKDYHEHCVNISKNNRSIIWHEQISQDNILQTLSQYDAFVFPTMVEEMAPLTIHEAFAAKLPIIGSKVQALMDEIQDGHNGLLFEFKNEASLTSVLTRVFKEPSLLETIRKKIQVPSTFEHITQTTINAYRAL